MRAATEKDIAIDTGNDCVRKTTLIVEITITLHSILNVMPILGTDKDLISRLYSNCVKHHYTCIINIAKILALKLDLLCTSTQHAQSCMNGLYITL